MVRVRGHSEFRRARFAEKQLGGEQCQGGSNRKMRQVQEICVSDPSLFAKNRPREIATVPYRVPSLDRSWKDDDSPYDLLGSLRTAGCDENLGVATVTDEMSSTDLSEN